MNIKFIRETKLNIIISIHQWFCHFRTAFLSSSRSAPFHLSPLFLFVLLCVGWCVCAEVPVYFQHLIQPTQITCSFLSAAASITYQVFVFHCCVRYALFQSTIYSVSSGYRLCNVGLPTPMWILFYLDSC